MIYGSTSFFWGRTEQRVCPRSVWSISVLKMASGDTQHEQQDHLYFISQINVVPLTFNGNICALVAFAGNHRLVKTEGGICPVDLQSNIWMSAEQHLVLIVHLYSRFSVDLLSLFVLCSTNICLNRKKWSFMRKSSINFQWRTGPVPPQWDTGTMSFQNVSLTPTEARFHHF